MKKIVNYEIKEVLKESRRNIKKIERLLKYLDTIVDRNEKDKE